MCRACCQHVARASKELPESCRAHGTFCNGQHVYENNSAHLQFYCKLLQAVKSRADPQGSDEMKVPAQASSLAMHAYPQCYAPELV
jgi:hypothetical protein